MNLPENLQIVGGSIIGNEHVRLSRNNQDAWVVRQDEDRAVATVSDGCGSGRFSEVGARVGANLLAGIIYRKLGEPMFRLDRLASEPANCLLEQSRQEVLERIGDLSRQLVLITFGQCVSNILAEGISPRRLKPPTTNEITGSGIRSSFSEAVTDFFLFTVIGFFATRRSVGLFHAGDGITAWNDEITLLRSEGNAPEYIGYELTGSSLFAQSPNAFHFNLDRLSAIEDFRNAFLGTDGAIDLHEAAAGTFPGKTELIGPIAGLLKDDRMFSNPDSLRRHLAKAAQNIHRPDWEARRMVKSPGLLPDDTTLILIRSVLEENR